MTDRADPFGDPTASTAPREKIRDVSELAGFPSRAPRRWRTGRNTQLNLKVSADVLARSLRSPIGGAFRSARRSSSCSTRPGLKTCPSP
jgi:hypothetical protein